MPKRTYQPNNRRRAKKHGFRARMATKNGRAVLKRRRAKRTQEINGSTLLNFRLPKTNRLRKPSEFRRVYAEGRRFEGRFMTVFILPSENEFQRLGITASKKAIGNAVQRNRAKRLLREAFRLSKAELGELNVNFDWVLNARRNLLKVKLEKPLEEFQQILAKIKTVELKFNKGEETLANKAK